MTFSDLQDAITRLATDPRVHPTTRIDLAYTVEHDDGDVDYEQEPLTCIALNGGCNTLVLCSENQPDALIR